MNRFKRILHDARIRKYGVGAFDTFNFETTNAVLKAARDANSPVIIMYPEVMTGYMPLKAFVDMTNSLKAYWGVDACTVLDHGFHYENVAQAIDAGFDAVMFDGSSLPYDENLRMTKEVVVRAHASGVAVEAELGHVGDAKQYSLEDYAYTDVTLAEEFVEQTGIDALAVAIGTAHGCYSGNPKLNFDLLANLRSKIEIPLVLHGGSSTGEQNLQNAVKGGIQKLNIYTDMAMATVKKMKPSFTENEAGLYEMLGAFDVGFYEVALQYIKVFKPDSLSGALLDHVSIT